MIVSLSALFEEPRGHFNKKVQFYLHRNSHHKDSLTTSYLYKENPWKDDPWSNSALQFLVMKHVIFAIMWKPAKDIGVRFVSLCGLQNHSPWQTLVVYGTD